MPNGMSVWWYEHIVVSCLVVRMPNGIFDGDNGSWYVCFMV